MPTYPAAMSITQFWLVKLSEECAEVSQRALKQIQFGRDQIQKGSEVTGGVGPPTGEAGLTNGQRLRKEINDLLCIITQLEYIEEIPLVVGDGLTEHYKWKMERLAKYLEFSQSLGLVEKFPWQT